VTHMKSIACYFEQVLDQAAFNQGIAVADTVCFSERDWSRICKSNSTIPQTHDRCIHEVIQEQGRLHPQREAVCAWDGSLTFEDLDHLASKVAYHLQCNGVGPETLVALCFDKSVRTVHLAEDWLHFAGSETLYTDLHRLFGCYDLAN
jgi:non-ribosomal peptide synthetase component F